MRTGKIGLRIVTTTLLLTACEKPFEPLAPSDLAFSIYGHLDASADTQWIRVTPIRESLEMPAGPIDAVVTLEELETGATVAMSDSLFRYLPMFGDADLYAHNFSTTMSMVPGRHYRLTATRSDGATASATVLIPTFQSPTLELSNRFSFPESPNQMEMDPTSGTIRGTRYLGMVLGREDIPERCNWPHAIHQQFLPVLRPAVGEHDDHGVQMEWTGVPPSYVPGPPVGLWVDERGRQRVGRCDLEPKRILAVASGERWPHDAATRLRELSNPASIDNIEGDGVGFLAGVQTHVFPFAGCIPLQRSSPCTITFGPRSATLIGLVTNGCTGAPMPYVQVQILSPSTNAIRNDTTDLSGVARLQGLEPDVAHSLLVGDRESAFDFFPVEVGNLMFAEAAVDTIPVEMTPRRSCPP